jgi:hypothetical protein
MNRLDASIHNSRTSVGKYKAFKRGFNRILPGSPILWTSIFVIAVIYTLMVVTNVP